MPTNPETIPQPCPGWRVGDALYTILVDAQSASLALLLGWEPSTKALTDLINHREQVIKILSMEPPKQRKPRADKGTHRQRKSFAVPSATAAGKP